MNKKKPLIYGKHQWQKEQYPSWQSKSIASLRQESENNQMKLGFENSSLHRCNEQSMKTLNFYNTCVDERVSTYYR
jgi:hypothetical protein